MILKNKNLLCVSFAFSALLTSAQTVQQYITVIFEESGDVSIGFVALLIGQLFFLFGSMIAPIFITKYGPKTCFLYSTPFYVMFAVSVGIGENTFLYLSCILIGIAAGILWNGHFVIMGAISAPKERARDAGFFWAVFSAITGTGMILSGFLVETFSYTIVFSGYAAFGALALVPLFRLDDKGRGAIGAQSWKNRMPILNNITVLRTASIILAAYMTYGLVISFIPLEIAAVSGVGMVGYLSSLFFIIPALTSCPLGKLADRRGHFSAIFAGLGMIIMGLSILYMAHNTWALIIGILVVTLGFSILNPLMTAMPTNISPKNMTERISATFNVASAIGILIGIIIPFAFYDKSAYLILVFFICIVAALIQPFANVKFDEMKLRISKELAFKKN